MHFSIKSIAMQTVICLATEQLRCNAHAHTRTHTHSHTHTHREREGGGEGGRDKRSEVTTHVALHIQQGTPQRGLSSEPELL